jgi:hypothetical protein
VNLSVAGTDSITVGAGTFPSALHIAANMIISENGSSNPYNYDAWFVEGIGMVKFTSPNMNRDLVSYSVNPVEPSNVEINSTEYTSFNSALTAANNNDELKLRAVNYQNDPAPTLSSGANITLTGGLSNDYSTVVGRSYVQGPLTIASGSITISSTAMSNIAIY